MEHSSAKTQQWKTPSAVSTSKQSCGFYNDVSLFYALDSIALQ